MYPQHSRNQKHHRSKQHQSFMNFRPPPKGNRSTEEHRKENHVRKRRNQSTLCRFNLTGCNTIGELIESGRQANDAHSVC